MAMSGGCTPWPEKNWPFQRFMSLALLQSYQTLGHIMWKISLSEGSGKVAFISSSEILPSFRAVTDKWTPLEKMRLKPS